MRLIIGVFCEKIPNFHSFLIFVANSDGVLFLVITWMANHGLSEEGIYVVFKAWI